MLGPPAPVLSLEEEMVRWGWGGWGGGEKGREDRPLCEECWKK